MPRPRPRAHPHTPQHVERLASYNSLIAPLSETLRGEIWLSFIRRCRTSAPSVPESVLPLPVRSAGRLFDSVRLLPPPALRSGTGFSTIHYFNGASKDFLVDMARQATTVCFAPKEVLDKPGTLYIVRSDGFVGVKGKLYSQGEYWGEDFILESATLRENIRAVALSYVEVVVTARTVLFETLEKYPIELAEIRHAVARMALIRAGETMQALTRTRTHLGLHRRH